MAELAVIGQYKQYVTRCVASTLTQNADNWPPPPGNNHTCPTVTTCSPVNYWQKIYKVLEDFFNNVEGISSYLLLTTPVRELEPR